MSIMAQQDDGLAQPSQSQERAVLSQGAMAGGTARHIWAHLVAPVNGLWAIDMSMMGLWELSFP